MQGSILMLIALSGLGCQNPTVDASQMPAAPSATVAPVAPALEAIPGSAAPPPYPRYFPENYNSFEEIDNRTPWDNMRATFCSFFIGRDPDVPTPRQIEAFAYGYAPGR
jgi:hypothetical protein